MAINFTKFEILSALLSGIKTQTIRQLCKCKRHNGIHYPLNSEQTLFWNQRSKYKWFRIKDGKGVPDQEVPFKDQPEQRDREVFPKKIREVIVTDVFKIIIWRENNIFFIEFDDGFIREFNSAVIQINSRIEELSKRDGFLHPVQLFQTLDGMYDLRNRKPFWVIRWRRLSL